MTLATQPQPEAQRPRLPHHPDGAALLDELRRLGIGRDGPLLADGATDSYVAIEGPDGGLIAAIADDRLLGAHANALADRAIAMLEGAGSVFLDANLPSAGMARIARHAVARGAEVVVNPVSPAKAPRLKPVLDALKGGAVVCNLAEANALTGQSDRCAGAAAQALIRQGFATALVTAGAEPAALATPEHIAVAHPPTVPPGASVTGAGDALCAAFLAFPDRATNPEGAFNAALLAAADRMREST